MRLPIPDPDPDALYAVFTGWTGEQGIQLYPAQDEAVLELVSGSHVILATPTGTGKSLVAVAAHLVSAAEARRSYYTAPIKALVSEKFFALAEVFGPESVGMVTGDSSVNPDAPIICCTAEILANLSLRHGDDLEVGTVVMDEFHFYAEADRGWAWQVPLLRLPQAQFLLMSATLGDTAWLADDLTRRTGRPTASVTAVDRPVPLDFRYVETPVHETVQTLLDEGEAPIYVVHFSKAAALERAQALASVRIVDRAGRDEIADALGTFRFSTRFGQALSRLVRSGIGVHHSGMLPKYRRLVEQLAGRGLLRVICGTDTLGVGINVPIRTVLLTALTKFDGTRMRQLTAREFHQIAGRAGRAGFDTRGTVVAQAPEHEVDTLRAVAKAGGDAKKLKKVVRKKSPEGFVNWSEKSFARLIAASPEPLVSRMRMTHSLLLGVIARGKDPFAEVRELIEGSHASRAEQRELIRTALSLYRTLRTAGVVTQDEQGIRLTAELQANFALNQPLSAFAVAALELLDPASPGFALDAVSVIEATLEDPPAVLRAQERLARGEAIGAMKAQGLDYDERMEALEEITHPKPLAELLEPAFSAYRVSQPWAGDHELAPKSVVRDMFERAMTFNEYTAHLGLGRDEGLVLRYLSECYRALRQTVPEGLKTEDFADLESWLGELVRQVDNSLVAEWEALVAPEPSADAPILPPAPPSVLENPRAFRVLVRNELFRRVQLAALDRADLLGELDAASGFGEEAWDAALDDYYREHDSIGTDAEARSSALLHIEEGEHEWRVRQTIADPAGHHDWAITATVDLEASAEAGEAVIRLTGLGER